jgi:hypothetical protein
MTAPLKIDDETDLLATHGAHFLGITKKQFVAEAVRVYTETRRAEIEQGAREALALLDGSRDRAVELMSGLSAERRAELGGTG